MGRRRLGRGGLNLLFSSPSTTTTSYILSSFSCYHAVRPVICPPPRLLSSTYVVSNTHIFCLFVFCISFSSAHHAEHSFPNHIPFPSESPFCCSHRPLTVAQALLVVLPSLLVLSFRSRSVSKFKYTRIPPGFPSRMVENEIEFPLGTTTSQPRRGPPPEYI